MNQEHTLSHLHVQNLRASSVVYYYCGALGHFNSICPRRRGIDEMNAIWIRKDVLKLLTNHSGPKNIWVP